MKKPSDPPKNGAVKIYIPPKVAIIVIVILIGGGAGGLGLSNFFNGPKIDAASKEPSEVFNVRFERLETGQAVNTQKIEKLDEQVGQIQEVQHSDIARTEARRVTGKIANRKRREKEYDRLVERNKKRLKKGRDPCQDLECVD